MISIIYVAFALLIIYYLLFFSKKKKNWFIAILVTIIFMPKINLISVSNLNTAGIRIDDILIFLSLVYLLFNKNMIRHPVIKKALFLIVVMSFFAFLSVITGIVAGYDNSISFSIFSILRRIEYFVLIFMGFFAIKGDQDIERVFYREFTTMNIMHFIVAFLQVIGVCGYAVSGVDSGASIFTGFAVSTFNGYYEFGLYLVFCIVYYLSYISKSSSKIMLILSLAFLCLTNSRTAMLTAAVILVFVLCYFGMRKLTMNKILPLLISIFCVLIAVIVFTYFDFTINLFSLNRFSFIDIGSTFDKFCVYMSAGNFDEYVEYIKTGTLRSIDYIYIDMDKSTTTRFYKWGATFNGFLRYPIFGYGVGITPVIDGNYFKMLGENGIVGTFIWMYLLFFLLKYFKMNFSKTKLSMVCFCSIIVVCIGATFIDMFEASKIMEFLWFIIGISICVISKSSDENDYTIHDVVMHVNVDNVSIEMTNGGLQND